MTPDDYCQLKAASSGSSFYHSFRFLPEERRRAITALYAFCREVDDIVDDTPEPATAAAMLEQWREEIGRLFHGQPQHPITQALQPLLDHFDLKEEHFREIIAGMEMDLEKRRYATFAELRLYCYRAASVVGLLSAEIFGYRNRATLDYADKLGMALQLTNILRDVGEDGARDRIYLPQEELAQFDVSEQMLLAPQAANPPDERLRALFEFQYRRAEQYYQDAFAALPEEDRYAQRSGVVMAAIYHRLLEQIRREGYPVLSQRVRIGNLHKLWLAFATIWQERRRHQRLLSQREGGL